MSFLSPYIWILKTLEEVDSGAPQAAGPRIKSAKKDWYILHEHELQVEPVDLTTFNQGLGQSNRQSDYQSPGTVIFLHGRSCRRMKKLKPIAKIKTNLLKSCDFCASHKFQSSVSFFLCVELTIIKGRSIPRSGYRVRGAASTVVTSSASRI